MISLPSSSHPNTAVIAATAASVGAEDTARRPLRSVACFTVAALLAAPLGAPPAAAQAVSDEELFAKSLEVAEKALETWGRYEDPAAQARIADLGYRVARHANYRDFPFSFYLLDMPVPNALALPGGHIFVTRGMLELGLTDDMLAALLGHEIGHVALDHHARMQKKATIMSVLSQALLVGVMIAGSERRTSEYDRPINPYDPTADQPTTGQVVRGAAAASLVLGELLLRSYSREHEDEADEEGQRWAAAAGYSPHGTRDLMALMSARMPQTKEYGYLQTHPFLDERVRAATARAEFLSRQDGKDADAYRQRTQAALLAFGEKAKDLSPAAADLLDQAALSAWPSGPQAEEIRLAQLHEARDETLEALPMARDYGALLAAYRGQLDEVRRLTPESELLVQLEKEIAQLDEAREALYPKAVELLASGVYETAFLRTFASNWPESTEIARVRLALGDAYARLDQSTEAVTQYLAAWRAAPESEAGKRARTGLRNLAPSLDELAALQKLVEQDDDQELREVASGRLATEVKDFSELRNGAEYLRRFPEGQHAGPVSERIDKLAQKLYNEIVLYRAVGESVQALERIQQILTYAPLSPAAEKLREQAVI